MSVLFNKANGAESSYLLFSHWGIGMLTITIKKLKLHALLKLDTSFLP